MQRNNRKKVLVKTFLVRVDEETLKALRTIQKETERNQADSVRWAVRKMAKALSTMSELEKA